jgi:hypothetical protein
MCKKAKIVFPCFLKYYLIRTGYPTCTLKFNFIFFLRLRTLQFFPARFFFRTKYLFHVFFFI